MDHFLVEPPHLNPGFLFRKYLKKRLDIVVCMECQVVDNEDHRLNYCRKWQDINFVNDNVNVNFMDIFSEDKQKLSEIIQCIQKVWELQLGNGSMKKLTH